jgi:tRNA modification GTPase
VLHGWIVNNAGGITGNARKIDEVLVSVFRAPRSYTGEDCADITCHGGVAVTKAVFNALLAAGFREAERGEFTFRAFMNGKLDLSRAESVMEIVGAKTDAARSGAVERLSGLFEAAVKKIKAALLDILAEAELLLDYSEVDGISSADDTRSCGNMGAVVSAALDDLHAALENYKREKIYRDGALVVIAGKPNAGKSSLFNALLLEERSIVTELPGTTRDWIDAWISACGIPLRLVDTAGLTEANNAVEIIGVARSLELLAKAELVLYVIDGSAVMPDEGDVAAELALDKTKTIYVWNKADIAPPPASSQEKKFGDVLSVSAKTGEGVASLLNRIAEKLLAQSVSHNSDAASVSAITAPGTERQAALVEQAAASLEDVLQALDDDAALDLVAPALREAVEALGEITGELTTADILENIFSRFCVGK